MTPPRRVAVLTGTRAEFGLLTPVMHAIDRHPDLELLVVAAGMHLIGDPPTVNEVRARFPVTALVHMQTQDDSGRLADAYAFSRGVEGVAHFCEEHAPDWFVVLGDRIEAFAGAAAASIAGIGVAHIHAGDRAEGIADEAMRHAITKLAHLHLPATQQSAERIERMGEDPERIVVVGSPGVDGMSSVAPLDDAAWASLGAPTVVILHHPVGRSIDEERAEAEAIAEACAQEPTLWLAPNRDPGWQGIADARLSAQRTKLVDHLDHATYRALLKRMAQEGSVLVGNSSSGLIEACIVGCPVVNIGDRQNGRERGAGVVDVPRGTDAGFVRAAIERARSLGGTIDHPFGDGRTGERVAEVLGRVDPTVTGFVRKRSTY